MPLPFAPPPSESKLYRDLKNLKLSEVTADQFDSLKGALFAQGVDSSEDEMRRLNLVGQASNQQSASGPIAGTAQATTSVSISDTGNYDAGGFTPGEGEVWQIMGLSVTVTNDSGTTSYYGYIKDSDTGTEVYVGATSSSSTNVSLWTDSDYKNPVFITDTCTLQVTVGSTANMDSYVTKLAAIRVR